MGVRVHKRERHVTLVSILHTSHQKRKYILSLTHPFFFFFFFPHVISGGGDENDHDHLLHHRHNLHSTGKSLAVSFLVGCTRPIPLLRPL